ncbi:hypothetical protein RJ639_016156 [Escallonia herrerae]|uniref:Uncharacterized protein n=1 Tax=Escallonia herrerae TaxID=1293975 RepID=A0AA89AL66_9ASTE|nr:hypothetical protein RJ639_016156 [Escallonia herrerae]
MRWLLSALPPSARRSRAFARQIFSMAGRLGPAPQGRLRGQPARSGIVGLPSYCRNEYNGLLAYKNLLQQQCTFSSGHETATYSSTDEVSDLPPREGKNTRNVEVEIISQENIRPSSPTPHHLRTYKLSLLDQFMPPMYNPFVFFYSNSVSEDLNNVIIERSKRLKESLSETLTRFYPFAGTVKDNLHIDCDDAGVYYVVARVKDNLSDFLNKPNYKLVHKLLPYDPNSSEPQSRPLIVMVQVNIFECGGMAISICTSHKIVDGVTYATFLKAWAENARGSSEQAMSPNFSAPLLFPQNPSLHKDSSLVPETSLLQKSTRAVRRFVFDASALVSLKEEASELGVQKPTRVEAVTALFWKCAASASEARHGSQRPSLLSIAVDLRSRSVPALPQESIGNIVFHAFAKSVGNTELELPSLVSRVRKAIEKINGDLVQEIKGDDGFINLAKRQMEFVEDYSNSGTDLFFVASLCNAGFYEGDFGWGKPRWSCIANASIDSPTVTNQMFLIETRSGGIEAWVNLEEQDMAFFEQNPELLAFASLDPSPLN